MKFKLRSRSYETRSICWRKLVLSSIQDFKRVTIATLCIKGWLPFILPQYHASLTQPLKYKENTLFYTFEYLDNFQSFRALRIMGRCTTSFPSFQWRIIFFAQVYLLQVWNSLFAFRFRCIIFRAHSKQHVKTNTWRASKNTPSLLASWNAALITSLVCVNVDHTI